MASPRELDEVIDSIPALLHAIGDRVMDATNLNFSKLSDRRLDQGTGLSWHP
ncbi:MAG: hypothetical protein OXF88_03300 [Rhodobacteraceae bacterium]|nr:hypothetical protein [Paracoccaceae bacterium]MCY4139601.1 hypothetical protein [Paracoccaceae bacterium]